MAEDIPRGAILQRDRKTYAIVPRTPVGLVSPEVLEAINSVVRDLFPMVLEAELPMYVCSACVKKYNIPEDEIVTDVKITTLPTVTVEMMDRETIMF